MIVRVLNVGQFRLDDAAIDKLNVFDDRIEQAVEHGDQDLLTAALNDMIEAVQKLGKELPDDSLEDSDLILPDEEATVADVRGWLNDSGSEEGLIPGRA